MNEFDDWTEPALLALRDVAQSCDKDFRRAEVQRLIDEIEQRLTEIRRDAEQRYTLALTGPEVLAIELALNDYRAYESENEEIDVEATSSAHRLVLEKIREACL